MDKRTFKKLILLLLISIAAKAIVLSQVLLTNNISLDYKIIDTVNIDGNLRDIKVEWLNDTIIINKRNDNYSIDTTNGPKFIELMEASAQNCYSYALEKYFENDSIYSQNLFNRNVTISGPSLMIIMEKHFHLIHEFSAKDKGKFMKGVTDNTVVGFVDNRERIIHLVYYDEGVFYTKNGMFPASEFTSIKKFLKGYFKYTTQLRIYSFLGFNDKN